ncbi:MAG: hypothetical protein WCL50_13435, partial [Spirochaetota bacterium]
GELTDPVLSLYAALCTEEMGLPGTTFSDIRGRGLPLGAPRISLAEADRIFASAATLPESPTLEDGGQAEQAFDGRAFLRVELGLLIGIEATLKGRCEAVTKEGLRGMILACDYLLWPFPDRERIRELPQDLLNRILVETEYWIWKLEELLDTRG